MIWLSLILETQPSFLIAHSVKLRPANLANSFISLAVGAAISYLVFDRPEPGEGRKSPVVAKDGSRDPSDSAVAVSAAKTGTQTTTTDVPSGQAVRKVGFSKDWGVLPASAFAGLGFNLLIPGRLKIDLKRVGLVGIKPEKAERVNVLLEGLEKKVQDYESRAVVRRSDKDGDFYYIPSTTELRSEYDKTIAAIRDEFADSPPSGEALLSVLFHSPQYSSFGGYNEEISIKDTTIDGVPQTVIETLYSDPARPEFGTLRSKSATLQPDVVQSRYPFFGKK